jgi:ketosteroid isomerase-like protein
MSEENVEVVRQAFEAWDAAWVSGADNFGELLALFDDDLVTRRLAPLPDPGIWQGRDGMLAVLAEWMDTFDDFRIRGEEFIDAGDHVVLRVAQEGRGYGSGTPVAATFWFVIGIRGEKMATLDMYATNEQALEAAAGSE